MDVGGKAVGGDTEEGEEENGERRRRRREERRRDNGHAYAVYLGVVCAWCALLFGFVSAGQRALAT